MPFICRWVPGPKAHHLCISRLSEEKLIEKREPFFQCQAPPEALCHPFARLVDNTKISVHTPPTKGLTHEGLISAFPHAAAL